MATLWITEYVDQAGGRPLAIPIPLEPAAVDQTVTFTTATQSSAFGTNTKIVRLVSSADCNVLFGSNPTATAAKQKLLAGVEYWRGVQPGMKVSVYDGSS